MEILFGIWFWTVITIWMGKKAASDVIYSLKGETPPRHRERMARIQRGESPQRYGVGGWLQDLQEDVLRANTNNRRAKVAKKARKKLGPVDDMVDATGVRADAKPAMAGRSATVADPAAGPGVAKTPTPTTPPTRPSAPPQPNGRTPHPSKPTPPTLRVVPDPPKSAPDPRRTEEPAKRPVPKSTSTAENTEPDPKENAMNGTATQNPTVEVTGLSSAVNYAKAVAAAHASHSTAGGESYINSLQSFNVTGTTITAVGAAQEASANAAAMWATVAEKLESQMNVKEAYNSNPDAGNQQFVQGE